MASAQLASSHTAPPNIMGEDFTQCTRHTRDGRVIIYRLKVLQNPTRARACGAGAKSSADRRPVDPPPIVQLKVYEGSLENEITPSFPANFFIFVSIEHSKPTEPSVLAKWQPPAGSIPAPVLTGTNVCSMSILDRPSPAGYFIFPDVSVRHEGWYRLVFDLYEDAHETGIMDVNFHGHPSLGPSPPLVKVLEVKSEPFEVFSAKKFPGLQESTALSRTFAEQGVRVRIRRDVRMRKRDTKGGAVDRGEDDIARERARISATPDFQKKEEIERVRSVSIAPLSRRPSMEQLNQGYAQSHPSPIAPPTPTGMYPPQMSAWQGPPAQQNQGAMTMQPPAPPAYQQAQNYAPAYPSAQQNNFMPPQYPARNSTAHSRHSSFNGLEVSPPAGPAQQHVQVATQYNQAGQPSAAYPTAPYNRTMSHASMPQPISTSMQQPQSTEISPNAGYANGPMQSPIRANHTMFNHMSQPRVAAISPRQSTFPQQQQQHPAQAPQPHNYPQYAAIAPPRLEHAPQPTGATKRTFSATFDAEHLDARLQHGERPISPAQDPRYQHYQSMQAAAMAPTRHSLADEENDSNSYEPQPMTYRRADGTEMRRKLPPGL